MMTNGYASDNSNSSNKRVRINDPSASTPTSGSNNNNTSKKGTKKEQSNYVSPLEIAINQANKKIISTLHPSMHTSVVQYAESYLKQYATAYQAQRQYDKDANDPSYVASSAKLSFTLQPKEVVSTSPEFNDLLRETQLIVKECRDRLTKQHLACTLMNNKALKAEVIDAFAQYLYDIADLLFPQEDIQGMSPHVAVANLLHSNRDEAIAFLKIDTEQFRAIYCRVHGLDTIPPPSNPPPPPVNFEFAEVLAMSLRGGGGTDDGLNSSNNNSLVVRPPTPRESLQAQQVELARQLNPYSGRGRGARLINNVTQGNTPTLAINSTPFRSAAELLEEQNNTPLQQRPTSLAAAAATPVAAPVAAAPAPTPQLTNNNVNNVNNIEGQGIPAADNTSTDNDIDMEDSADNNNNNNGEGGNNQQPPPQNNNNNINNNGGGGGGAPSPAGGGLAPNPKLISVHSQLLTIIQEVFVKPLALYEQQVDTNDTTARINKVVRRKKIINTADKVAATVANERQVPIHEDKSLVKVMIKEEVTLQRKEEVAEAERRKKEKAEEKKKKAASSAATVKNSTRGPTGGGASGKKKSSSNPSSGGNTGGGNSNATNAASRRRGTPSSKGNSRRKGNASKTSSGSTRGSSKKK